ncbi:MAG: SusC/RagA family TonB-linked outer membrane protein, partial [Bacteroides sp.]
ESITVINDALGAAMLGMLGGNGVINIITKRGHEGKLRIEFTSQLAWNKQMYRPKLANSYEYASLYNQALAGVGKPNLYSEEDLNHYRDHTSPYLHPDVDWYKELLKPTSFTHRYSLDFSGGTKAVKYFVDLNVFRQNGFFKQKKSINSYNTQEDYEKYSLRSKLDIDLTQTTQMELNIYGLMTRNNDVGGQVDSIYSQIYTTPRNAYPKLNPNGSLGGSDYYKKNLYGQSIYSGYHTNNATDFSIDVRLNQDLGSLLKGLYASLMYSYNSIYREKVDRSKDFEVFNYDPRRPEGYEYRKLSEKSTQVNSFAYDRTNRMMVYEAALGYDYAKNKHTTKSKILFNYNNYLVRNLLPLDHYSFSGRSQYNYNQRYFAELAWSVMGMNQFKKGHRTGFFPAAGFAWNISNEEWFPKTELTNNLKLRTSFGIVGNNLAAEIYSTADNVLPYYYDYMSYYLSEDQYFLGTNSMVNWTYVEGKLPATTTWSRQRKLNIGLDGEFFNRKLSLSVEYYRNLYSDILMLRGTNNSGIVGVNYSLENLGKTRYQGVELEATFADNYEDFEWLVNGNISLSNSKRTFLDEPEKPYKYMRRTGTSNNQMFGYKADGFFNSQEEIDKYLEEYSIEGYIPRPGDLKYKDINGDKIIDDRDITRIGGNKPFVTYGFYTGFSWKGIGLNMQWSGLANNKVFITEAPFVYRAPGIYGQALKEHLDSWSPENKNASYPRPTIGGNAYNEVNSTFWLKSNNYLRLKHVELSYDLPIKWISAMKLSKLQLFATAYNLLTFSAIKDRDPESLSYSTMPNLKSFTFGINVLF